MAAQKLKQHLKRGKVYRRSDLEFYTGSPDRDLKQLLEEKYLKRLRHGLYYRPQQSKFGTVPPELHLMVSKFLKSEDFVMLSYSDFNRLGLGLTQLYNEHIVYNNKRHGLHQLNGQTLYFKRRNGFPRKLTPELLFVAFLNERNRLAEKPAELAEHLHSTLCSLNRQHLKRIARDFGKVSTRKTVEQMLNNPVLAT